MPSSVAGLLAVQLDGDRLLVGDALGGSGEGLAADGEVSDEAVLAVGALVGGIADIEHRRGYGLALAGFLQDDVGIAVHQAVDRGEVARLGAATGCRLGLQLHLGEGRRRSDGKTEQQERERAHTISPRRAESVPS
jgi:hypothetical protein